MLEWLTRSVLPVGTIVVAILLIWYAAAIPMNAARTLLDSETSEMSLSADSSNVIVARARRIALQPLLWTAP